MVGGDVAFSVQSLLGQMGGALAIAYGAGAASGWAFAIRTAFRSVKRQVDEQREAHEKHIARLEKNHRESQEECEDRISKLERKVDELCDREREGLLRQIAQARQSAEIMTGRIEHGRLKPMDE